MGNDDWERVDESERGWTNSFDACLGEHECMQRGGERKPHLKCIGVYPIIQRRDVDGEKGERDDVSSGHHPKIANVPTWSMSELSSVSF